MTISAESYHVSPNGNDSNSGLEGSPWRTIAKACNTVAADQGHVIHIGEGTFTETEILKLKSGVSLIGAGSNETRILVNHHFSLTDAVLNANPHVHTFPEHFVIQMNGSNQVVKGISLDGQEKRCHGGIFAASTRDVVFEDLHVSNFRYCGLWIIEANDTILRFSRFKNNTYGNPKPSGEGGNPLFPALRSGHRLFQRPSHKKQIPSNQSISINQSIIELHTWQSFTQKANS